MFESEFDKSKKDFSSLGEKAAPDRKDTAETLDEFKLRLKHCGKVSKLRAEAHKYPELQVKLHPTAAPLFVAGVEVWKTDVKIKYQPLFPIVPPRDAPRGIITERTAESRKRLSFTLSNTETPVIGHLVLTWRVAPLDGRLVKKQLRYFLEAMQKRWKGEFDYLWWLEFQKRGAPHIHLATSGTIHDAMQTRKVQRWTGGGTNRRLVERTIYCGPEYDWAAARWLVAIGASNCVASQRWSAGGIWEKWDTPDGAARYAAKDAWKPHQTQIPDEYQNVGGWWHRSRGFKAPEMSREITGGEWDVREYLNMHEGKLFPVLFGKAATLKNG